MQKGHGTATAEVKDYSLIDANDPTKGRNDGSKTVKVPYEFDFDILETVAERDAKFSQENLTKLANQRLKATANSTARQAATAKYAPDPNDPRIARENVIADMVNRLKIPRDIAEQNVDALLAMQGK